MKEILLKPFFVVFTIFGFFFSEAQIIRENLPEGVTIESSLKFSKTYRFASFFFKDKNQRYWIGYGATPPKYNNTLSTNGLISFKDTSVKEHSNAIFTGYVERGDSIIFASNLGLQYYKNEIFRIDSTYKKIKDIIVHKGLLIAATEGNGIIIERKSGLESVILKNQGILYDSIYSLFSDGDVLWLGTQKGLISISGEINNQTLVNKIESSIFPNLGNLSINKIVKDKYGRIWFTSQESLFTRSLYMYENNNLVLYNDAFSEDCQLKYIREDFSSNWKLNVNKNGNVVIQSEGLIFEFFYSNIKSYIVEFGIFGSKNIEALYFDNLYITYIFIPNSLYKLNTETYNPSNIMNALDLPYNIVNKNNVESRVGGSGLHFNSFFDDILLGISKTFKIKDLGCARPLFNGTLWIGALDSNNKIYTSAETFRQSGKDFWSGPIEYAFDSIRRNDFLKIWKVNKETIDNFIKYRNDSNYSIPSEILEWPGSLEEFPGKPMAPFEDINKNGVYEPFLGEYPKIKGDQMLWWIFNDAFPNSETAGEPLKVEVHGSCYAFYNSQVSSNHADAIINRTLFFNYKIYNYSNIDYQGFKVGIYNCYNLGNWGDDRMGCDTLNNASFVYNNTNYDSSKNKTFAYGPNPPIFFCKFLNQSMTNHMIYFNNFDPTFGFPQIDNHYFNYLNSLWKNNSKLTFGGNGTNGTIETNYAFPGKICGENGWSEKSAGIGFGERYSLMSTGLEKFQKDSVFELDFAYIMLHDPETDFLIEECDKPSNVLQKIQNWYDTDSFPSLPSNKLDFALNSEWHYDVSANNPFMSLQRYSHTKDTSIQGKHVRVIEEYIKNQNGKNKFSKLYIYENGDTVFLYNFNKNKFLRFLIFNAPIGSVLELDVVEELEGFPVQNFTLRVNDIQIKYIDGIPLKYYQASIVSPFILSNINLVFMDKIGWFNSFYPILLPQTTNTFGGLRCFRNNEIDTNYTNVPCNFMYMLSLSSLEKKLPLHVYPNPSADILNLDFDSRINDFTVNIMNINGVQMHSSNNQRSINVKDYSPGLYYLILKTETQLVVKKWIKL
jgi:Fe-S cluster assembly iron-binding protein IscA